MAARLQRPVSFRFHPSFIRGGRQATIAAEERVELRVLGPVEVVGDGGSAPRVAAKQRRLLTALAAEPGKAVTADALIEALWGEVAPRTAGKVLHVYVSRLRKVLPDGIAIQTEADGYWLEIEEASLDAARF
jgi:DNA-binding SARP family transcriptional activator